jgi:hypothetical protein
MVSFNTFIKRWGELPKFLNSKAGELLIKHEKEIIKLNNTQLLQGKNVQGKIMQRGYSPQYGKKRQKAGLQTAFVDTKFTGKYHDTKKGEKVKGGMNIISNVDYEKHLRNNFPDHVGLNKGDSEAIAELMADDIAVLIDKFID